MTRRSNIYFGGSNYLSVALQKDITDRIASGITATDIGGITYQISQPRNLGSAKLKGIEASAQLFLDFLPGALSGFGVSGNFHDRRRARSRLQVMRFEGSQLLGVSKYNYTAALLYEKYGFSGRLVYTHRSRYFDGDLSGGLSLRPVDETLYLNGVQPSGRLDFGLNYDLSEHFTLSLDGTNITRAKYQSYYGTPLNPHDVREDDFDLLDRRALQLLIGARAWPFSVRRRPRHFSGCCIRIASDDDRPAAVHR